MKDPADLTDREVALWAHGEIKRLRAALKAALCEIEAKEPSSLERRRLLSALIRSATLDDVKAPRMRPILAVDNERGAS